MVSCVGNESRANKSTNPYAGRATFYPSGIVKMKLLTHSYVWWHQIDQDIEKLVSSCEMCATHRGLPPKAPLHSWPWVSSSMQRIHIDYVEIESQQMLVIIDGR